MRTGSVEYRIRCSVDLHVRQACGLEDCQLSHDRNVGNLRTHFVTVDSTLAPRGSTHVDHAPRALWELEG
jgi:hypothetical protein